MRKMFQGVLCCMLAVIFAFGLTGCGLFGSGGDENDPDAVYTIQYTDDAGTHTIEVKNGDLYTLEAVPYREGYTFLGLFDAETGGTQYVSASGASVSAFSDRKNLTLYPQFKANEYTLILDYGDAAVTGERQMTVTYGQSLPELPKNLTLEHSEFAGWYTQEDCRGTQVADAYGLIPLVSEVNSANFDLSSGRIVLYAGFELEKHRVTFHFGGNYPSEELDVPYGTPISQVVPETRNEQGFAVLTWSRTQDGSQIFNGSVTDEMVLYAVDWAPVIELDANGGEEIAPIVARAGASVTLPTPVRENYRFLGWRTANGSAANITQMPASGTALTAAWQAMLVFDENGGSEVNDISENSGAAITLPVPERSGYVFAGWYTPDRTFYNATVMPSASVKLKAGWYAAKSTVITLIENDTNKKVLATENSLSAGKRLKLDLSELMPNIPNEGINISYTIHFAWGHTKQKNSAKGIIALYDGSEFNSSNELKRKELSHDNTLTAYPRDSMSGMSTIHNNVLYIYYAGKGSATNIFGQYTEVAFFDVYVELVYPITTYLYL